MRYYTQAHRFYCGVDLHARTMYLHVLDGVCSSHLGGKWRRGRVVWKSSGKPEGAVCFGKESVMVPRRVTPVVETRDARIDALMAELRPQVEASLRRMVERVVDVPEHEEFGAIEVEFRDAGQGLANTVRQAGLTSRKKRAT